jgi:hypothetical protein
MLFTIINHIFCVPKDIGMLLDLLKLIILAGSNFGEGLNKVVSLLVLQTKPTLLSILIIFIVKAKRKTTKISYIFRYFSIL